ncbi:hypothetical protein CN950_17415 [Bacillus cereus]|nr:hypothetical protein CN407_02430 [Bacillus cereus]PGM64629.1 hypothetical protein CN950_17415 [Bacillus cereus]
MVNKKIHADGIHDQISPYINIVLHFTFIKGGYFMPISKEPILYPSVSSTPNEFFTFDWNWGLHKVLDQVTGLVKFIPGIGILAGPYSALLRYVYGDVIDELFPKTDANGNSTTDLTLLFQTFMAAAEQMMDQKISNTVKETAIAQLKALHQDLLVFQQALDNLKNNQNPNDEDKLKSEVQTKFGIVHTFFVNNIAQFTISGYEVELLSTYAQAANLHLMFLRTVQEKGTEWGFAQATIDGYYDSPGSGLGFKQLIEKYTNYCMKHYNDGLQKIKVATVNLCAKRDDNQNDNDNPSYYNQYLYDPYADLGTAICQHSLGSLSTGCGGVNFSSHPICKDEIISSRIHSQYMQSVKNWNQYNEYVQTMQVTVLDLVAIWPYWDYKNYPDGAKKELTREIYTDIHGSPDGFNKSIDSLSQALLPQPRLFTFLQQLDFHTDDYKTEVATHAPTTGKPNALYHYIDGEIIVGIDQHFINTNGQQILQPQGSSNTGRTHAVSGDFTKIQVGSWFEPRCVVIGQSAGFDDVIGSINDDSPWYNIADGRVYIAYQEIRGLGATSMVSNGVHKIIGADEQIDSHVISYVKFTPTTHPQTLFVNSGKQLGSLTTGWTSTTVDSQNTVVTDSITSIPVVKAHSITDFPIPGGVVKGPGHTGGDLVKLPPNSRAKLMVNMRDISASYDIRIRYATPSDDGKLNLKYWNGSSDVSITSTSLTNTGGNTDFNHFQYAMLTTDDVKFKAPFSPVEILLENTGANDLFLDRIEFIPTMPTSSFNDQSFSVGSNTTHLRNYTVWELLSTPFIEPVVINITGTLVNSASLSFQFLDIHNNVLLTKTVSGDGPSCHVIHNEMPAHGNSCSDKSSEFIIYETISQDLYKIQLFEESNATTNTDSGPLDNKYENVQGLINPSTPNTVVIPAHTVTYEMANDDRAYIVWEKNRSLALSIQNLTVISNSSTPIQLYIKRNDNAVATGVKATRVETNNDTQQYTFIFENVSPDGGFDFVSLDFSGNFDSSRYPLQVSGTLLLAPNNS